MSHRGPRFRTGRLRQDLQLIRHPTVIVAQPRVIIASAIMPIMHISSAQLRPIQRRNV
jgi:hypothetical protein